LGRDVAGCHATGLWSAPKDQCCERYVGRKRGEAGEEEEEEEDVEVTK
jgi:hypothetical protein